MIITYQTRRVQNKSKATKAVSVCPYTTVLLVLICRTLDGLLAESTFANASEYLSLGNRTHITLCGVVNRAQNVVSGFARCLLETGFLFAVKF